jgi:hypothetical protein
MKPHKTPKKKSHKGNTTGVKDKFDAIDLSQVYRLGGLGLNYREVGLALGVDESTVLTWNKKHPEFDQALKKGRQDYDTEAVVGLRKRVTGYRYTEVTREWKVVAGRGRTARYDLIITKTVEKEVAPEPIACFFWLQNRKPDSWKNANKLSAVGDLTEEQTNALRSLANKAMEEMV